MRRFAGTPLWYAFRSPVVFPQRTYIESRFLAAGVPSAGRRSPNAMKSTSSNEVDPSAPPLPSQGLRTVLSLLLFVHLFALSVALLSNPRDGMTSPLLNKLGGMRLLSGYLQMLWMDMSYDYFHTYGPLEFVAPLGTDHVAEVELKFADGSTRTLHSPAANLFPRQRYLRYKSLWNNAARTVGQQGAESMLPAMVLESLLRQTGAESATLTLKRHLPMSMDRAQSNEPKDRDPFDDRYYQTLYTGYGQMRNGRFTFQKLEDAGDSAPAAAGAAPAAAAPPPAKPASN